MSSATQRSDDDLNREASLLYDRLVANLRTAGVVIEVSDGSSKQVSGYVNFLTTQHGSHVERTPVKMTLHIQSSPKRMIALLLHETAHYLMHSGRIETAITREQIEYEACLVELMLMDRYLDGHRLMIANQVKGHAVKLTKSQLDKSNRRISRHLPIIESYLE